MKLVVLLMVLWAHAMAQNGCVDPARNCANNKAAVCKKEGAYSGTKATTKDGKACTSWAETRYTQFPENYCRSTDGYAPWCYTDTTGSWAYCFESCDAATAPAAPLPAPAANAGKNGGKNGGNSGGSNGATNSKEAAWVAAHNKFRGQEPAAEMPPVVWNAALANLASEWAQRCVFEHRQGDDGNGVGGFERVGENLFWNMGKGEPSADLTVGEWYSEKQDFDFGSNTCSTMCGHYTQVVWAKTTAIGCAVQLCPSLDTGGSSVENAYLAVCNYGPGGNWNNELPYTLGK